MCILTQATAAGVEEEEAGGRREGLSAKICIEVLSVCRLGEELIEILAPNTEAGESISILPVACMLNTGLRHGD